MRRSSSPALQFRPAEYEAPTQPGRASVPPSSDSASGSASDLVLVPLSLDAVRRWEPTMGPWLQLNGS